MIKTSFVIPEEPNEKVNKTPTKFQVNPPPKPLEPFSLTPSK